LNVRAKPLYEFGPFRLDAAERVLLRRGSPLRLPAKVLDTLLLLVENHGHILEKDDLMKRIWPDTFVEENNLNKTVSAVRKALGEGAGEPKYIDTIPKRGYRFSAPVRELRGNGAADGSGKEKEQGPSAVRSVAVLPFKLLSPDRSDEYLGAGMADTLITRLSNMRRFVVRPTSSVLKYQAAGSDPVVAGRELRVDSVLEGTIRRAAERIRVTVQLVNVADGAPVWAEKFDEDLTDMFAVEDSISERAVRAMVSKITHEEQALLTRHPTDNPAAHQLYLRGRYHAAKLTPEGLRKGYENFQRAIALDPGYALAHVGLAYYYFVACNEFSMPPAEAMPKTEAAALAALRLDDTLAEAHAFLASVRFLYDWNWPGAETEFERAAGLNPHNSVVHLLYGMALMWNGRFDHGIDEVERALEIDPLSPEIITCQGICHYFARRHDAAIGRFQQAIEIDPRYWFAHLQLGRVLEEVGRLPEAIEALETAWRIEDAYPEVQTELARAYALAGKKEKARKLMDEVTRRARRSYVPAFSIARGFSGLGRTEEAFAWLEKAFEARSSFMPWLRLDPALDPLRPDERFSDLVRRVGLD